jgi:hypothetical protein
MTMVLASVGTSVTRNSRQFVFVAGHGMQGAERLGRKSARFVLFRISHAYRDFVSSLLVPHTFSYLLVELDLREHALFALRNLLYDNSDNQEIVRGLEPMGTWDTNAHLWRTKE